MSRKSWSLSFWFLLAAVLFSLVYGKVHAQSVGPYLWNLNTSEDSQSSTVTILPPWEEDLRKLEALLDSWEKDSNEQANELREFQAIVDSLSSSLTSSEHSLKEAQQSETRWKNQAAYWKNTAEAEEQKRKRAESSLKIYKGITGGAAILAVTGWILFAFSI